jgi:hypothetical protein
MSYSSYYPNGWQSGEAGATPITPAALNYMENGIKNAQSTAENASSAASSAASAAASAQSSANSAASAAASAQTTANAALPKTGGTLSGALILTEGVHYGSTLPSAGNKGRIFFKKVSV